MARRILMIDDDRLQFRLVQAYFKGFRFDRYDLDWQETFEGGLEKLLAGGYDACLIDYQLGERDGLQLIREAVARGCHTPLIVLTAESSAPVDIEAMNAGAIDYLVKGEMNPAALERSLRYALRLGETLGALRRLATHDELTGLLNRREFDRLLAQERERAQRFGHSLAVALIDVDQFKEINDGHGHPAGDAILREIAARLRGAVRSVDFVARLGGDEFAAIMLQADQTTAMIAAKRLCSAVGERPISTGADVSLPVTVSVGVSVLQGSGITGEELVAAADRALYAAKAAGRNRAGGCDEPAP
jgi:diguanylate cyclase (GGDEF)-like protein